MFWLAAGCVALVVWWSFLSALLRPWSGPPRKLDIEDPS